MGGPFSQITVNEAGVYLISFSASPRVVSAGPGALPTFIEFRIFVGGVLANSLRGRVSLQAVGETYQVSFTATFRVPTSVTIRAVASRTNTTDSLELDFDTTDLTVVKISD